MEAYIIADIDVFDSDLYKNYQTKTPKTVKKYGGNFVVRGGSPKKLEGDWEPSRLVVIEFENVEAAREWYFSEEYQSILNIRQKASNGRMVLVEGA